MEETYNALMNSRKKWADDNMFRYADAAILKAAELAVEEVWPYVSTHLNLTNTSSRGWQQLPL